MNRVSSLGAPSIDRLQVLVQSRSITASKCISKLARSRPPSVSTNSLQHGLQVHLSSTLDLGLPVHVQTRAIAASECISKLAPLRPPSSHSQDLQVHLLTRSITASKCISKLARLRSRSASLSSLNQRLQVYLQIRSVTASKSISKVARDGLGVYLWVHSIVIFRRSSNALNHRLQPVQIYRV